RASSSAFARATRTPASSPPVSAPMSVPPWWRSSRSRTRGISRASRVIRPGRPPRTRAGSDLRYHRSPGRSEWDLALVLEAAQQVRAAAVPQLAQRLSFDLPDALAGDGEVRADLLERVVPALPDAEAKAEHPGLADGEGAERTQQGPAHAVSRRHLGRSRRALVLE